MNYQTIQLSTPQAGIAQITMNRPEALNALSGTVIRELSQAIESLEADRRIRAVVLTGAGKAFVAGADIAYMAGLSAEEACL